MEQRITLHIAGGTSRSRAEQARIAFGLGHHAEVYSDLDELLDRPPRSGVIVACENLLDGGIAALLERLGNEGIWVPLVAASTGPGVDDVVGAIQAGALDYLQLPLTETELVRMIAHLHSDAGRHGEARRRLVEARRRIGALSKREREVLDWLSEGCSNKAIARELEISPRTVEIHRANMMDKLGASHAAEAVRLRLDAGLEPAHLNRSEEDVYFDGVGKAATGVSAEDLPSTMGQTRSVFTTLNEPQSQIGEQASGANKMRA